MLPYIQEAVVYYLEQSGKFGPHNLRAMPDEHPTADSGEVFLSVYPTGWQTGDGVNMQEAIDEIFNIGVCISARSAYSPEDREFETVWRNISKFARMTMRAIIPNRWKILQRVNTKISTELASQVDVTDSTQYLFYEPLTWQGNDPAPTQRQADWWKADLTEEDVERHQGYSFNLFFNGMRLTQPNNSMEL